MKPVLYRKNLTISEKENHKAFIAIIDDLWKNPLVCELDGYGQHMNTSRRQHSLNVAYYSYAIAKKLNLNVSDTVRGAMLHDLYLYDWHIDQPVEGRHVDVHPREALANAKSITEVSDTMADCIVNHMWPMGEGRPQSKEAWVVQASDKLCAFLEIGSQISYGLARLNIAPMLVGVLLFVK
jgi:uncharacterized protein